MLLVFLIALTALVVAAGAAGVLYCSQDSRRASVHLDKQRLREVGGEANEAMAGVVRSTREAARKVRDYVVHDERTDDAGRSTRESSPPHTYRATRPLHRS